MDIQTRMILIPCAHCHQTHTLVLPEQDVLKWLQGALVQDAFPHASPETRELLVSRTCPECWDKMFPDTDT